MRKSRDIDYSRLGPLPEANVVISGGCGGIGSAITRACVNTGLNTIVLDLKKTYESNPCPKQAKFVDFDAHDENSVIHAFAQINKLIDGKLDALINLVGAGNAPAPVMNIEVASFDEVISRNLRSAFLLSKHSLPLLAASKAGSIIHTSSGVAARGVPGVGSYSAAKGGLVSLTKTIAVENGPLVRCNAIAPGGVTNKVKIDADGKGATGPFGMDSGKNLANMPLGRFADPEDLVGTYLFLAGPASIYITGQVIHLSGGLVTPSP
tara:strand:- start:399 stop:1193 length:795 start_codon:yes stop_codon:yes gene_type:complete